MEPHSTNCSDTEQHTGRRNAAASTGQRNRTRNSSINSDATIDVDDPIVKKKCSTCGSQRSMEEFECGRATCTKCLLRKRKDSYASPLPGKARCSTCRREQLLCNFTIGAATCNKCLDRKRAKRRKTNCPKVQPKPSMVRVNSLDLALVAEDLVLLAPTQVGANPPPEHTSEHTPSKNPKESSPNSSTDTLADVSEDMDVSGLPALKRKLSDLSSAWISLSDLEAEEPEELDPRTKHMLRTATVGVTLDCELMDWLQTSEAVDAPPPVTSVPVSEIEMTWRKVATEKFGAHVSDMGNPQFSALGPVAELFGFGIPPKLAVPCPQ